MNVSDGIELDAFLSELQPAIARAARALYYRVRDVVTLDLADLEQEGMIAAWRAALRYDASKVVNEHSFAAYCKKTARGAMLMYLREQHPTLSIDAEFETQDGGTMRRELEATHAPTHADITDPRILAGVRQLSGIERLVILAYFCIPDEFGNVPSWSGIPRSTCSHVKIRGLRKLASFLQ